MENTKGKRRETCRIENSHSSYDAKSFQTREIKKKNTQIKAVIKMVYIEKMRMKENGRE